MLVLFHLKYFGEMYFFKLSKSFQRFVVSRFVSRFVVNPTDKPLLLPRLSVNKLCNDQSARVFYKMSSENELVAAIKESLQNDGTLNKFEAEMRTKIIAVLNTEEKEKPKLSKESLIVNELIREYLNWSGYRYAKSVFVQECGLTSEAIPRGQLLQELGVSDTDESVKFPVLYGIISSFREENKE